MKSENSIEKTLNRLMVRCFNEGANVKQTSEHITSSRSQRWEHDMSLLKFMAPLLALFGVGGSKDISRFGFVPEGSIGIRMRFGKVIRDASGNAKLMYAGWNKRNIPFIDRGHHRSIMPQSHKLEAQDVQLVDQTFFVVSSMVSFHVIDIEKIIVGQVSFQERLQLRCEAILLSVLSKRNSSNLQNIDEINSELFEAISTYGEGLGVEFDDFNILRYHPTHETAQIIQTSRIIEARACGIKDHAINLAGIDVMAATILSGTAMIATNAAFSANEHQEARAAVIPIQSVPDPR